MVEGLVENIPRKGCRVRPFNWSELDEIFELRLIMEVSFAHKPPWQSKTPLSSRSA